MKLLFRRNNWRQRCLAEFVSILVAFVCLSTKNVHVQCDNNTSTYITRTRREISYAPIHWAGERHIYVQLQLGSDCQNFNLALDTLGVVTWVASSLTTSTSWMTRRKFTADTSTTFKQRDNQNIGHQLGWFSVLDTLRIAELEITEFPFRLGIDLPSNTTFPYNLDGVLGLPHSVSADGPERTLLDSMAKPPHKLRKMFGIKLCPGSGMLTFGGVCSSCYKGNLLHLPLKPGAVQWMIQLTKISLGTSHQIDNLGDALMDTICDGIEGPAEKIQELNKLLGFTEKNGARYYLKSYHRKSLPVIKISSSSHAIKLTPDDYLRLDVEGKYYSIFRENSVEINHWIFGLPFNYGRYIIYDRINHALDMASAVC